MYCEMSSTPMTRTLRATPVFTIEVPTDRPYMKLVQAVLTSKAAAAVAPMRCWTAEAEFGTVSSLLQLP